MTNFIELPLASGGSVVFNIKKIILIRPNDNASLETKIFLTVNIWYSVSMPYEEVIKRIDNCRKYVCC